MPRPLIPAEFAGALEAIGGFETAPLIAVAVSGGPDSLALVLLTDRWARQCGGRVLALTVDHGLRRESAAEARAVAAWLAARGLEHETLAWVGAKPKSGLQQAAREARYRLLGECCRARGALHLMTAHHREDQIETHLIRRRAGSGIDGLSGMSALRELPGCRLVRPLLAVPRARLQALLTTENQPFLHDPSNLNPVFERTRARAVAATFDAATLADFVGAIRDCGRRRAERERALDALLARAVTVHPAGFAALDPAAVAATDAETAERLLGRLARCIGGAPYSARRARLARLRAALAAAPDRARTLGGCRFVPWRGRLLVLRELAAASPSIALIAGSAAVWDRRFAVATAPGSPAYRLGCLGQFGSAPVERHPGVLPRLIYPVLPALWDERGLAAVPHLNWRRCGFEASFKLAFRPTSGLTQAGFTVV